MMAGEILERGAGGEAASDVVLELSQLRAGYGDVPVLRGVSLRLREGEAIGIVGHNGMGKTTLLRTIMGLMPANGGRITIDGVDVTNWPAYERSRRLTPHHSRRDPCRPSSAPRSTRCRRSSPRCT